ncbi:adenylate kinase [Acinetobacter sp. 187]|uniref:adenylate kinase n=1 Tax=Acinetobacter lanii TaxID=2715163 RepID=UPI00140ADC6B|nr:adenylate kinase [Acinetobacter lanii]NHC03588.1 adenylate kinase [Acinetobacter lanii]
MKRINVVGTSASGKSTFSKVLAQQLNLTYIELDDLFWLDDWQESSDQAFFKKLQQKIDQAPNGYVIDGNYTRTKHIKWQDIDTIIWLDLPFHVNVYRAVKRAIYRAVSKQKLWNSSNNQETFKKLFSRESIILWMMKTHRKNRKQYLEMMQSNEWSHIHWIRLRSVNDIHHFLEKYHKPK